MWQYPLRPTEENVAQSQQTVIRQHPCVEATGSTSPKGARENERGQHKAASANFPPLTSTVRQSVQTAGQPISDTVSSHYHTAGLAL
jgi:hypothetical protein